MNVKSESAPGKLFLLGEYAVLENGPALLVPVKQQAFVSIEPADTGQVISHTTGKHSVPLSEALLDFPLLKAVVDELGCIDTLSHSTLVLDTSAFFRGKVKLGLGSSAALTVALCKLFLPDTKAVEQFDIAMRCHLSFQNGVGSGADIALAAMGEPITYKRGERPLPVTLPDDLHMLAIWTGEPASTTGYVAAVNRWRQGHPESYQTHIDNLRHTAEACLNALVNKDTHQVLARIEQYDRHLEHLSSISGVNFYNQTHLEMRKKVELVHCVYKPSGAGGGDFGIAYSADNNELNTLAEELEREQIYTFVL